MSNYLYNPQPLWYNIGACEIIRKYGGTNLRRIPMTNTVAVTDLNTPIFVPFWEENVLPGGWTKQPASEVVFGPVEQIVVSYSGSQVSVLGDVYGNVTYTSWSNGSTVDISGYVGGDVYLKPLADWNSFSSADVFGGIYLDDAWETTLDISGFVGEGLFVNDVRGGDYDIDWTPTYLVEDSTRVEAELGTVGNVNLDNVDQSLTEIGALFGDMSISGDGNEVVIGESVNAEITIGDYTQDGGLDPLCELLGICDNSQTQQSTDTFVFVDSGDVNLTDFGQSSTIRLGDGNDSANLAGSDTIINMGDGFDFVTSSADGALVSGAEWVTHESGDLTLMDIPVGGSVEIAGSYFDLSRTMWANGQNQNGNAVLDTGDGILAILNGSEAMLPIEDYAFAA